MADRKTPELRFEGFDGDWEEKKLGDIVTQNMKPIPTPKKDYERLGVRSFARGTFHEWVEARNALDVDTMYIVEANNLITNITFAWELAITVTDESDEGKIVSHRFPQFKFNNGYYPNYFKYAILDPEFRMALILASPGGAGRNRVLGIKEFLNIPRIVAKDFNEQQQIGLFFKNLDQQILLTQEKLDKTKTLKKTMLQKMFPLEGSKVPEIRLEGFSGDWEEKKIGQIFSERNERSSEGELLSVTINYGVVKASELDRHDSSSSDKSNYKVVRENDIAYNSMRMWQGASGYSRYTGIVSPAYTVIIPAEGINPAFFAYLFKTDEMIHTFEVNSQGLTSDTWNLKYPELSQITVKFPEENEQKQVVETLRNLDSLITTQSQKLDLLKTFKKSLLEKMFV